MAKDDVKLVGPAGFVMMPKAKERTLLASGHYRTPADFLKAQTEASAKADKRKPLLFTGEDSAPVEPEED